MDRLNEEADTIELGTASVETRGVGFFSRDTSDEAWPNNGLAED
jgi:hypothetical protein